MRSTVVLILASACISGPAYAQPASSPLKIVVIKGEDAVNIIQQKTAVAPVVEVRDRNNLPVPGATVTFSLTQGASFGGAPSLTVVTNAAGQAAATGFTPTAAGAIQIQASAAFQGQTAVATITQSNVMTAASASGTATPGAAVSGGGAGISGAMVGVIAAVAGGGAVAATQLGKKEPTSTTTASTPTTTTPTSTTPPTTTPPTTAPTPTPQPTNASYAGDVSGPLTGPSSLFVDDRGNVVNCDANLRDTGRASLNLTIQPNGDVSGTWSVSGKTVDQTTTCSPFPDLEWPLNYSGAVSGSASGFRFSQPIQEGGPYRDTTNVTYTIAGEIAFSGSRNGDSIAGTLTHNIKVAFRGPNWNSSTMLSASIPLTLR